jgi:hypothetical protein
MRKDELKAAVWAFRRQTWTVMGGLILVGITLIAFSVAHAGFWGELLKELGIVLVAVFGVSIMYEILMAERHFERFFTGLRAYIERGESNAAACADLGILEIFPGRDVYQQKHRLQRLLAAPEGGSRIRIIGSSLFHVMTVRELFQGALERGAVVELCTLDPETSADELAKWNFVVLPSDLKAGMDRLRELCKWVDQARPAGSLQLRHHRVPLIDSFASFDLGETQLSVWDVNLGPDLTRKRTFLVDATKGLGKDLTKRYDHIWNNAAPRFRYPAPAPSEPAATGEPAQK